MKTFLYDLLYLNQERGGTGLSKFSDAVNIDKLAELLRAYRRTDEVADAAIGVIESFLKKSNFKKLLKTFVFVPRQSSCQPRTEKIGVIERALRYQG